MGEQDGWGGGVPVASSSVAERTGWNGVNLSWQDGCSEGSSLCVS